MKGMRSCSHSFQRMAGGGDRLSQGTAAHAPVDVSGHPKISNLCYSSAAWTGQEAVPGSNVSGEEKKERKIFEFCLGRLNVSGALWGFHL